MTFDQRYSETVSLSKILDCFLVDGEKPSTILSFLSNYEGGDMGDIFNHSKFLPRMMCLSFLKRCTLSEAMKLLDYANGFGITKNVDSYSTQCCSLFVWQICRSDMDISLKSKARDIGLASKIDHPYKGIPSKRMQSYDTMFLDHSDEDDSVVFEAIGRMDLGDFTEYVSELKYSLWRARILQLDFFESLDIQKQYAFITTCFIEGGSKRGYYIDRHDGMTVLKFCLYRQMMGTDIDVEIKKMLFDSMSDDGRSRDMLWKLNSDAYGIMGECSSMEELFMTLQLYGIENYAEDIITNYLLTSDKKSLLWMLDNVPDVIRENLDVRDLIETWK